MMKTKILIVACIAYALLVSAQLSVATAQNETPGKTFIKPNFKTISHTVRSKNSEFYYPTLFARYQAGDKTLSDMEKYYIYYGYITQPDYEPYALSEYDDSLHLLLRKDTLLAGEKQDALRYIDDILQQDPFNVRILLNKLSLLNSLERTTDAHNISRQIGTVMTALTMSGDGLSQNTAIYVINIHQEYDYLYSIGFDPIGQQLIGKYDYILIQQNEDNVKGFYFDISAFIDMQ